MAAAEELRVPLDRDSVRARRHRHDARRRHDGRQRHHAADDPSMRQAAAAVRKLLVDYAAEQWSRAEHSKSATATLRRPGARSLGYADCKDEGSPSRLPQAPTTSS